LSQCFAGHQRYDDSKTKVLVMTSIQVSSVYFEYIIRHCGPME
jgi:hypothetical protein